MSARISDPKDTYEETGPLVDNRELGARSFTDEDEHLPGRIGESKTLLKRGC